MLIGVVHTGKKDNNTIGHFGSMIDRYAQSVIEIIKDKENNIFFNEIAPVKIERRL